MKKTKNIDSDTIIISADIPFCYKYIGPIGILYMLYLAIFDVGISELINQMNNSSGGFPIVFIIFMFFLFYTIFKFAWYGKNVSMDEENFYISNYITTMIIPIKNFKEARQTFFMRTSPEYIELRFNCNPRKVLFIPKEARYFSCFLRLEHPLVEQLNSLARRS